MPDTYCIESNCYAFSGRCSDEPGRVRAYFKLTEGEAVTAILGLLEQGLDVGSIVEDYNRKENW